MSYRYFSQQLIDKNLLDLSQVFADKQAEAQKMGNVAYSLGDIVLYLQDVTDDFKLSDRKYIDLDNAIQSIIEKYYKSIGQENPFLKLDSLVSKEEEEKIPREAAIVEEGKVKVKGVAKKSPKEIKEEVKEVKKEKVVTKKELPPVVEQTDEEKIQEWEGAIAALELLDDEMTEEQMEALETLKSLVESLK